MQKPTLLLRGTPLLAGANGGPPSGRWLSALRSWHLTAPLPPSGLILGDVPNRQPIGIVLTVLGVVVLDFSADATEGPIRAYLLDVVDSEEQDMALNIHAFSAGESAPLLPQCSLTGQGWLLPRGSPHIGVCLHARHQRARRGQDPNPEGLVLRWG